MPKNPPNKDDKKTCQNEAFNPRMYKPGMVKIAPATMTPDAAPMDCTITFSERAFLRLVSEEYPTAKMAMGMAASNT